MATNPLPIPLLCIGRLRETAISIEQSVTPHFKFTGIIDMDTSNSEAVRLLLKTLNPYPAGVVVGGGISLEVQQEVEKMVREHNEAGRFDLKLVCIPVGLR